ncbi:MAG TPA: DapH/DapD/GlmU-related protein, partial [Candidatus Limnocylindrales bacterium]|nr:DapH/DapD/GlmU-related protein [Candidatus Limnocylindrales bacterium]
MVERAGVRVHPTAEVSSEAVVGPGSSIWNQAQIRERARIGAGCVIGKNVYVDVDVVIGDHVKVQNNVSLFHGVTIEDGVFIGPHVCFTNDRVPRAVNVDGSPKSDDDWEVVPTLVRMGAALGANSTILPGVTIGRWAMVGSGSVVTPGRIVLLAPRAAPVRTSVGTTSQSSSDFGEPSTLTARGTRSF